jgi:hypothetical protein
MARSSDAGSMAIAGRTFPRRVDLSFAPQQVIEAVGGQGRCFSKVLMVMADPTWFSSMTQFDEHAISVFSQPGASAVNPEPSILLIFAPGFAWSAELDLRRDRFDFVRLKPPS